MKKHELCGLCGCPMPPMEVMLFHSERKMMRNLAERGVTFKQMENVDATTTAITLDDGSRVYAVLLRMEQLADTPLDAQRSLLVHEAVHVAARYFEDMGESHPGEEELAYTVQLASSLLFELHDRYLEKESK